MTAISIDRKLRFLSAYMVDYIDSWPNKRKPFDRWLESTLDKRAHKGKIAEINHHKNICRYCVREFDYGIEKTKDHVVPVSRGGLDLKLNRVPCCWDCNQWKGDKTPENWLKELQKIVKKENKIRPPYNKAMVGLMIGRLKKVIEEAKSNQSKISTYKL